MRYFCPYEKHGASIWAGCGTRTASDAGGRLHGAVRLGLWNQNGISILSGANVSGDKTAGLLDAVECLSIDDEVSKHWESTGAERFDINRIAVLELAHVELASGGFAGTVRDSIDGERAHAADAFAAIVIKRDGFLTFGSEVIVDDIEHLEEGTFAGDIPSLVIDESTLAFAVLLTPDFEMEVHL